MYYFKVNKCCNSFKKKQGFLGFKILLTATLYKQEKNVLGFYKEHLKDNNKIVRF